MSNSNPVSDGGIVRLSDSEIIKVSGGDIWYDPDNNIVHCTCGSEDLGDYQADGYMILYCKTCGKEIARAKLP